jgi:hypothetical protein
LISWVRRASTLRQLVVFNSGLANSDAAYILAQVQADRGHPEAARALLKAALDIPGLFVGRNDAREWLDRLTVAGK